MTAAARPRLRAAELAAQLLADPQGRAGPGARSATVAQLTALNPELADMELELLADAVDNERDVLITYRDKNGNRSIRQIQPREVYGRWLDSWCHLRNADREFTVANIESVAPPA
jgi:predicted DNA-binding transcriptional regulator YafY